MAWQIASVGHTVSVRNDDTSAATTTDYHKADAMARAAKSGVRLYATGYAPSATGGQYAIRLYARSV